MFAFKAFLSVIQRAQVHVIVRAIFKIVLSYMYLLLISNLFYCSNLLGTLLFRDDSVYVIF